MVSVDETFPQGRVADELRVVGKEKGLLGMNDGARGRRGIVKGRREVKRRRKRRKKKEKEEGKENGREGGSRSATRRWHFAS